jgi:hypothetical protein
MFASDRDLLAYEPNIFRDVMWVGQRLLKATGAISGTTLTISNFDVPLDAAGVGAGSVVTVSGVSYEVLSRSSGTQATISRLRPEASGSALPPSAVSGVEVVVGTFRPQIRIVHDQLLRMVGIEPSEPDATPSESNILNGSSLAGLECLGALHLIFAAASAASGPDSAFGRRAELYRARFGRERELSAVRLDLDGDGVADATRRFNVMQFVRG